MFTRFEANGTGRVPEGSSINNTELQLFRQEPERRMAFEYYHRRVKLIFLWRKRMWPLWYAWSRLQLSKRAQRLHAGLRKQGWIPVKHMEGQHGGIKES